MANLIMFTAMLLLVVMPYGVFAQSSTNVSVVSVSPLPTTISPAGPSSTQSSVGPFTGQTTTAAALTIPASTAVLASNPTVQPTPSNPTVQPTSANPTTQSMTNGSSSVKPTAPPCLVLRTISFLKKTREDLDNEIEKHKPKYKFCTKNDDCCKGNRDTDVIFISENRFLYIYENVTCVDMVGICQCRAGFLSASFLLTIVGMMIFFIN